jgi:hypothetical protein
MINELILDDILKIFINMDNNTVCKYWYDLWIKKQTKLTVNIVYNISKISVYNLLKLNIVDMHIGYYADVITNEELMKFTNITSLSLINNKSITNASLNYLTNLTDLKLDYYDNLSNKEPFDFCTNIKKLSVTFSKRSVLSTYKRYWITLKETTNTEYYALGKFTNLTDLDITSCDYGFHSIMSGLRELSSLTNLRITRPATSEYNYRSDTYNHISGIANLKTDLFSLNNPNGFSTQEKETMLRNLYDILSVYEYTGIMGD